jgi:hypothetical protein
VEAYRVCEMLRIPDYLDIRLTDGGKVVSPAHRPRSTKKYYFSASGTHFCYRLGKPQGLVQLEGIRSITKQFVLRHVICVSKYG